MSATDRRSFLIGVPGEFTRDQHQRLLAAGVHWKGSYDELVDGWQSDIDLVPWRTRQVVQVHAEDPAAAMQRVAEALGRSELATEMSAA